MSFIDRCREGRRSGGEDEGFTLIELLVVLLIIGILLAIAIPTFLSVTKGANSTAAQSNLQTAFTGANTFYTQSNQTFSGIDVYSTSTSSITAIDTGISYVSGAPSSSSHVVSLWKPNGNALMLMSYAPGVNDCWGILDIKSPQATAIMTETQTGTYYFVYKRGTATKSNCTAATGLSAAAIQSSGFPAH